MAEKHALILYEFPSCPYCRRVLDAIDDLGVEVELRDTIQQPAHRDELRRLMGSTQVPTLLIDGKPMRESADIIDWLYTHYGEGKKPPQRRGWW